MVNHGLGRDSRGRWLIEKPKEEEPAKKFRRRKDPEPWKTGKYKEWNKRDWREQFMKFWGITYERLCLIVEDKTRSSVADMFVASIIKSGIEKGDPKYLDFLLDRTIGKVSQQLTFDAPKPFIVETLNGETVAMGVNKDGQTITLSEDLYDEDVSDNS
jgi:hypothetical protein